MKHATLSASGSHRWIACPGSIRLEASYDEQRSSPFAEEGTVAHALAELALKAGEEATDVATEHHTTEMVRAVQEYLDYVHAHETITTKTAVEVRVDFSHIAPGGFGTADVVIYDGDQIHVIDFKFGKGIKVGAERNSQLMLYALGALNFEGSEGFTEITMHIVQPRIYHFDSWSCSREELGAFGKLAMVRAKEALSDNAPFHPGDIQCRWCRAQGDCKALSEYVKRALVCDFEDLDADKLSDAAKAEVLSSKTLIASFLKNVEDTVMGRLLEGGEFEGWYLTAGRGMRKWKDDAEKDLDFWLGEAAYQKPKLVTITEAQKLLSREQVDGLTYKTEGKPTLAKVGSGKPPLDLSDAAADFEVILDD